MDEKDNVVCFVDENSVCNFVYFTCHWPISLLCLILNPHLLNKVYCCALQDEDQEKS
jgi:hypothetical protein